jgi:hypothetical protein
MLIPAVHGLEPKRVLDEAPMLLRSCGDFLDIGNCAVDITTIRAVQPFNGIQITQLAAIKNDVITPPDFGNAISWKADKLVNSRSKIQQRRWDDS